MGQAAVDLPDPKDAQVSAPSSANSADDLLAQLAGEEIDRLLSEDASPNTPEATSPPRVESAPLDSTANNSAPVDSIDVEPDTAAQIDAVLSGGQTSAPSPTPAAIAPLAAPEDAATAAEMRQLLNDKSMDAKPARTPIYVRALMLLNSPFAHAPDVIREMMGKVAILTLFNSVAVLFYVLIFRRHK